MGFYDPFLQALGGGEKYFLTMFEEAARLDPADLRLFAPEPPEPSTWRRLRIEVAPDAFRWVPTVSPASVTEQSHGLDLFVAMTNDFPPLSRSHRSVVMVQFPSRARERLRERALAAALDAVGKRRGPAALRSYDTVICNSEFTRHHIGRRLGAEDALVIPPPVDPPMDGAGDLGAKQHSIAAVGRFFRAHHDKRHDVLIEAFRRLVENPAHAGWELHLAGGASEDARTRSHLEGLKAIAAGLPITFRVNASADEVADLLRRSSLFWHAAGYGVREDRHPERTEHFGIATVEAMMYGTVPLVIPAGGQPEIVTEHENGLFWRSIDELVERSAALIADRARRERLAAAAMARARRFEKDRFLTAVRRRVFRVADPRPRAP
jgi:glycosyltransferase involved in cell wall biosynthesis